MEIIASILGALVAVLIGAWIQNIFTWKIQNRVVSLDATYLDVLKYNEAFLDFCLGQQNLHQTNNHDVIKTFNITVKPIIDRTYLNCFIIDEVKAGKIYNKIYIWHKEINKNLNQEWDNEKKIFHYPRTKYFCLVNDSKPGEINNNYQQLFDDVQKSILKYRKKITSVSYMIKSIMCIK